MTIPDPFTDPGPESDPDAFDPSDAARSALSVAQVMAPDDLLADVDPAAALYFFGALGWHVFRVWVAAAADLPPDADERSEIASEVLQSLGQALGMIDAAQSKIGLIPPEQADGSVAISSATL